MSADIFVAILGGVFFLSIGLILFFGSREAEKAGKAQAEAAIKVETMEYLVDNANTREGRIAALTYGATHGFIDKQETMELLAREGVTLSGRPLVRS